MALRRRTSFQSFFSKVEQLNCVTTCSIKFGFAFWNLESMRIQYIWHPPNFSSCLQGSGRLTPTWRAKTWKTFGRPPVNVLSCWLGCPKVKSKGVGMTSDVGLHEQFESWNLVRSFFEFKGLTVQFNEYKICSTQETLEDVFLWL